MTLEEILAEKQAELEMGCNAFSLFLGLNRTWYSNFRNDNIIQRPLRENTMYKLHNRLDIDYEVMNEYNNRILKGRQ